MRKSCHNTANDRLRLPKTMGIHDVLEELRASMSVLTTSVETVRFGPH